MADLIPDYCEPLLAWRVWNVKFIRQARVIDEDPIAGNVTYQADDVPHLSSAHSTIWQPYERLEAKHHVAAHYPELLPPIPPPASPCDDCPCDAWDREWGTFGCGIYGVKSAEILKTFERHISPYTMCTIVGQVALWGRIVEHELGYRAQYAYPKCLVYYHFQPAPTTRITDEAERQRQQAQHAQRLADSYGIPYEEDLSWTSVFQSNESLANLSPILSPSASHLYFLPNQYGQFLRTQNAPQTRYQSHPLSLSWFPPDEKEDDVKGKG